MTKHLREYLPLYLGQKVRYRLNGIWSEWKILTPFALHFLIDEYDDGEIELLLRPLSSITIEEAAWCLKETFFDHVDYPIKDFKLELVGQEQNNPRISINNDWFKEELTFGCKRGSIWGSGDVPAHNVKIQAKIFFYLLSKGFDLFNLIPEGFALDLTQHP